MDLRTKLVFALVLTSLGSMFTLGGITYVRTRALLRERTLDHIETLAQTRKESAEKLISGWKERVSLIASRTQLRQSVQEHNRTGDPRAVTRVHGILADALASVGTLRSIVVFDERGQRLTEVAQGPAAPASDGAASPMGLESGVVYQGIVLDDERGPQVEFRSALVLGGQRIGSLEVALDGWELTELIESADGLGGTGQTILSARDKAGVAYLLRSRRAGPSGRLDPLPGAEAPDAVRSALDGDEGRWDDLVDRRGQRVWAASRFLPEVGWGLTVAFDEAEELAPIQAFRKELTDLALSLSAIAILLGTLIGLRFSKPLRDLARVADRIRGGELGARAPVEREDEIGLLARTFNQMTEELERQVVLLREFQKFFDVSLDMMCIAGTDGYFKRVNPAFPRTLGWTVEELLEQPFFEFVHPDDVEATEREVGKLSEGLPTVSFQNRYRCADGSYRRLLWASYPDPDTGRLYAIARDITDLRTG